MKSQRKYLFLLLAAAGRRREDTAFHRSWIDRIPTEVFLGGMGFVIAFFIFVQDSVVGAKSYRVFEFM